MRNANSQLFVISCIHLCLYLTGLSLILNIEADEYLGDFSESYGAVIDITSSKVKYFPEENGYLVAPGQITNIGFSQVSITFESNNV